MKDPVSSYVDFNPLATAPQTVQTLAQTHGFHQIESVAEGYCATVYLNPTRALKIPFQGEEMTSGYHAAHALQSVGGPQILAGDPATGTLLMQRLLPGTKLIDSPTTDDLSVFARLARQIHRLPPTPQLLPLADYYPDPVPLAQKLLQTSPPPVFLHGDLHHENILLNNGSWCPIDPKGLLGDPHFECAAFLRNPIHEIPRLPHLELRSFTLDRINRLAQELSLNPKRIAAWLLVDRTQDVLEDPASDWAATLPVFQQIYDSFP